METSRRAPPVVITIPHDAGRFGAGQLVRACANRPAFFFIIECEGEGVLSGPDVFRQNDDAAPDTH
jgi:hypothetical protein